MQRITITLPLPDSSMSGHAKGHWRGSANRTKLARNHAHVLALAAGVPASPFLQAVINFEFFVPDLCRRDTMNMMHGCKAYVDGIVDAGVMVDDDWKILAVGKTTVSVDRDNPRVEITIQEATR